ncbi:MAG: hypothetical protein ACKVOK_05785 [Flavobacteriales bacterium]
MKLVSLSCLAACSGVVLIYCCGSAPSPHALNGTSMSREFESDIHVPDSLSVPQYIEWLTATLLADSSTNLQTDFMNWSADFGLDAKDNSNAKKFVIVVVLHELFTSNGAYNGAKGDVVNIPYLWHWVSPNPRHEIRSLAQNKLLKDIKPPKQYGKYATYADIDRTPYLFVSEMFSKEPLYSHPECGTFNTFGWCSEREMAYSCLLEMLGIPSKVIASGNHSWSEAVVKFKTTTSNVGLHVHIDNTFNQLDWEKDADKIAKWKAYTGDGKTTTWYNTKAHSEEEKKQLAACEVDTIIGKKIYAALEKYFK